MKTVSKVFALCILLAVTYRISAQGVTAPRPDLFNTFSSNIPVPVSELNKAFTANVGAPVQLNFASKFSFAGTVFSSVKKYDNLSCVIIKSPLFHNALLSISRITNDDNTTTYVGRIINEKYADGYELVKDDSGNYKFNKIRTEDLIQDF